MDECVKVPLPNVIINGDTLIYVRNYVVSTRQLTLPANEAALSIAKTIYKVFDVKCDRVYYGYKPNKDDIIHFYICLESPLCISNLGNSLTTVFNDLVIIGKGYDSVQYCYELWLTKLEEHERVLWDSNINDFRLEPLCFEEIAFICKKKSEENRQNPSLCSIM